MNWSQLVAPEGIIGLGLGLALFTFIYALVVWRRKQPLGTWLWQRFPLIPAMAGVVFASITLDMWWAQHNETPVSLEAVVFAGCAMVLASAPAWAYQRDNKQGSVRLLPYIGSLIASSIGVSLFLRIFALYVEGGWLRKLLDFLFMSSLPVPCIFVALWAVVGGGICFGWIHKTDKPARKPRD